MSDNGLTKKIDLPATHVKRGQADLLALKRGHYIVKTRQHGFSLSMPPAPGAGWGKEYSAPPPAGHAHIVEPVASWAPYCLCQGE